MEIVKKDMEINIKINMENIWNMEQRYKYREELRMEINIKNMVLNMKNMELNIKNMELNGD